MFRCTLDELVEILTTEFPIPIPGQGEVSPEIHTLLHIIEQGNFGQQEAMGVSWIRQTIYLTDADTLRLPYRISDDDGQFPQKLMLLRLRVDEGRAIIGFVPKRSQRNAEAIGKHRITKEVMYRATDAETATKMSLLGPGLGQAWLDQFKKA